MITGQKLIVTIYGYCLMLNPSIFGFVMSSSSKLLLLKWRMFFLCRPLLLQWLLLLQLQLLFLLRPLPLLQRLFHYAHRSPSNSLESKTPKPTSTTMNSFNISFLCQNTPLNVPMPSSSQASSHVGQAILLNLKDILDPKRYCCRIH
jgi:hypothetical protein